MDEIEDNLTEDEINELIEKQCGLDDTIELFDEDGLSTDEYQYQGF